MPGVGFVSEGWWRWGVEEKPEDRKGAHKPQPALWNRAGAFPRKDSMAA